MASSNPPTPKHSEPPPEAPSQTDERAAILNRQKALGRQLRAMFDAVKNEPLPQSFLDLLDDLERKGPKE